MARILFVCTGNTCRSPMAEAILKSRQLPGIEVRSAGVFAAMGSDASRNAKMVLDEKQISHEHQSSPLTKETIDWASYILTMTVSHKRTVISSYPEAAEKTFTLKEFSGAKKDLDISDPFGGDVKTYRDTFNEIEQAINKVLGKIE